MFHLGSHKLACALLILVFAITSGRAQTPAQPQGEVEKAVAQARSTGSRVAVLPIMLKHSRAVGTYSEELKLGYAFVVRAIASQPTESPDHNAVNTYYKLQVVNVISSRPLLPFYPSDKLQAQAPHLLLPLSSGEILLRVSGGELPVAGVRVRDGDPRRIFLRDKLYLVVVEPTDVSGIFALPVGPETTFAVGDDGDTLTPLGKKLNSSVQDEVLEQHHGSLASLRARKEQR